MKEPLTRCSDDEVNEVQMFLSSVQEGVLEYNRKVPKDVEELDSKADHAKFGLEDDGLFFESRREPLQT